MSENSIPPGARRLLYFQVFNVTANSIALGPPMILLARHLGGSTWDASLLTAFATLGVVVQLVSAPLLERFGYRRSFAAGWLLTAGLMALVAVLPLGVIPRSSAVLALLALMLVFHAIRSFAQLAWFPWLTRILPTGLRGRFVGLDIRVTATTSLVALIAAGGILGTNPDGPTFALTYGAAALCLGTAGVISSRVPDSEPGIPIPPQGEPFSVRRAATYLLRRRPFRRALLFIASYYFFFSPIPLILVLLQEDRLGLGARDILLLQAATQIGIATTSASWGRASDRFGTRPVLRVASVGTLVLLALWSACIIGSPGTAILAILSAGLGAFQAAQSVGIMKLLMQVCPPKVASQSTAIFQAVGSFAGSLSPVLVGAILAQFGENSSTGFVFAMAFVGVAGLGVQYLLGRIPETGRQRTNVLLRHAMKRFGA